MKTEKRIRLVGFITLTVVMNSVASAGTPVDNGHVHDCILNWNEIALDAVVRDHSGTFGAPEQGGPTRTSRALAIVHIAMYDAANAIIGEYEPYIPLSLPDPASDKVSVDAAVAQAAYDTLVVLYPKQSAVFWMELKLAHLAVPLSRGRAAGIAIGAEAAANILAARFDADGLPSDGGDDPNLPSPPPPQGSKIGVHQADPINPDQGLLTPLWGAVVPFAMDDVQNFKAPPPPRPDSPDFLEREYYAMAYYEVMQLGGNGVDTPTERTQEQTEIGLFWGYDGSIGLGVPPRLYNQAARVIAMKQHNSVTENARLFALLNIAMADAGIASWYTKYEFNYWRPVIAIRCGDEDGNELTVGDPNWTPLGAPATNQSNGGRDFTPPFPAYTSGHATFGAAAFGILENLYGENYAFALRSDELQGSSTDSDGNHRMTVIRQFSSFQQAARENADSRIYLGIHWSFDADAGIAVGEDIADYTFDNLLQMTTHDE